MFEILAASKPSHEQESMDRLINPGKLLFNKVYHLEEICSMDVKSRGNEKIKTDLVHHGVKDFPTQ